MRRGVLFVYVEPLREARTRLGNGASRRAGEGRVVNGAFFNILLDNGGVLFPPIFVELFQLRQS
jgi:hypothetical protein